MKKIKIIICIFILPVFIFAAGKQVLSKELVNEHWVDISF
jgi:hypothetical protein